MNPVLNSESFDRAAYALSRAMDNFSHGSFSEDVTRFERSVDKLARVLGMQAENDIQKSRGEPMVYDAGEFFTA